MATTQSQTAMSKKAKTARTKKGAAKRSADNQLFQDNPNLQTALQQIEKQFGEGSIMPLGSEQRGPVPGVSTGSLSLDIATVLGGLPLVDRDQRPPALRCMLRLLACPGGLLKGLVLCCGCIFGPSLLTYLKQAKHFLKRSGT